MAQRVTLAIPGPNGQDVNVSAANPIPTAAATSGTATLTSVDSTTSAVALIAANTSRKAVSILNTDANALYILYAASGTPSATNLNTSIPTNGTLDVPGGYTGAIRGAWAADGTGAAKITEFV